MLWGLWGIHINIECDLGNYKALSLTFEKNKCIMGIHPNVFGIRTDVITPMLVSISTYLDDARHIWCIVCIFCSTLWICLVMVKRAIGHILGIVGVIDMKQKGNFMIGCWVHYVTLTLDLTDGLDLRFSKGKFSNCLPYLRNRKAARHWVKEIQVDHLWPWLWTWCDHGSVGGCTWRVTRVT